MLLIGPEGGLAENERQFAPANGFIACRLGPRVMRTETAGLAALALLQTVAGDFSLSRDHRGCHVQNRKPRAASRPCSPGACRFTRSSRSGSSLFSLGLGHDGLRVARALAPLDAFLNAAMLLGGMGPVNAPVTDGGKLFAGFFALYAGLVFIVTAALLFTPLLHRLMHRFHWDDK